MSRATALLASAALAALVLVTACGPDSISNTAAPSQRSEVASSAAATPAPQPSTSVAGHAPSGVPDAAWITSRDIPLDSTYRWPAPVGTAKAAKNPVLQVETVCGAKRSADLDGITERAHAARAVVGSGGGDWQAQETLVNWPGPSSGSIQTAAAFFRGVSEELKACAATSPGASVNVAVEDGEQLAATATVPQPGGTAVSLHEYLVNDSGTVAELSIWSTGHPGAAWSASDAAVLKALRAPLCSAFQDC